jgi:hypothetical protein
MKYPLGRSIILQATLDTAVGISGAVRQAGVASDDGTAHGLALAMAPPLTARLLGSGGGR